MKHWEVLNDLIKKNKYTKYLEIGVQSGHNYRKIKCKDKSCVDISFYEGQKFFQMSSDEFFKTKRKYDLIFIDGNHEASQAYKDIINALNHLTEGGTVVCHDIYPYNELMQRVPRQTKEWTGDCWKAWEFIKAKYKLDMTVITDDYGIGIIKGKGFKDKKIKFTSTLKWGDLSWQK